MSDTDKSKPDGYVFGRPTKYEPWMCEKVIEYGKAGKSRTWIAAKLGVVPITLDRWSEQHEDFCQALTLAKVLEQAHWEDIGHDCMIMPQGQTFSQSAWSRSMAARFPDGWREKIGHVGGNKDDEPIKQELTLDADAFTRAVAGLATRSGEDSQAGGAQS